jgi:hypothetical protein
MENTEYRQNLRSGTLFFADWFCGSKWGRLRLPRQKENGLNIRKDKRKFLEPPTFKTVVWAGR